MEVAVVMMQQALSRYGSECCPLVVDPYTWLALIGGIALATFFLRWPIQHSTTSSPPHPDRP